MNGHRQMNGGSVFPMTLAASAIISLLALTGMYLVPITITPFEADIFISPDAKTLSVGEEFLITVEVSATVPVNVFTGMIWFNNQTIEVLSINYNTSVADLWTQEPWFKNGDGSIGFAGGTTKPGGFIGSDTLMTVTFRAIGVGEGNIMIENARILEHNGRGTDATIALLEPTFFTVASSSEGRTIIEKNTPPIDIVILEETPGTDLTNDGKTTLADLSVFMLHLSTGNRMSDFTGDGFINTADLSILLQSIRL